MKNELILLIRNRFDDLPELIKQVDTFLDHHSVRLETLYKVNLILEEVLTNIIKYAFNDKSDHQIRVVMKLQDPKLIIEFIDDGQEFDPLSMPPPKVAESISESEVGGLGIHLVRQMSDGMEYHRHEDRNILRTKIDLRSTAHT